MAGSLSPPLLYHFITINSKSLSEERLLTTLLGVAADVIQGAPRPPPRPLLVHDNGESLPPEIFPFTFGQEMGLVSDTEITLFHRAFSIVYLYPYCMTSHTST